jgi:thiol-disulfide isomerase/thioredoxin
MSRLLSVCIATLALSLAAGAARAVNEGEKAPDFALPSLDGGPQVKLSDFRGKVVLVDFWATWCAPCIQSIPEMQALARKMGGQPFAIVGVNTDGDDLRLRAFLARHPNEWMQVRDRGGKLARETYGVRGYPTYLVLDREGRIVRKVEGWDPGGIPQQVTPWIEQALRPKPGRPGGKAAGGGAR